MTPETEYMGETRLEASDAVFSEAGPYNATVHAEDVKVTLYTYRMHEAAVVAKYGLSINYKPDVEKEILRFQDANINLSGNQSGLLHLWPGQGGDTARFAVNLSTEQEQVFVASATGGAFLSPEGHYHYNMPGPTFGLGHGTTAYQSARLSESVFQGVRATGSLQLVATNGTMEIQYAGGKVSYRLESNPGEGEHIQAHESARASYSLDARGTFAVIDLPVGQQGSVTTGVEGEEAVLFAQAPDLYVNGTVGFHAEEGEIRAAGESRTLSDDRLELVGDLSLNLAALGEDDFSGGIQKGWGIPHELLDDPPIQTTFTGDANDVRVNGNRFVSGPAELREEVTLIGKVLGALLLLWGISRRLLFFAVGLLTKHPLEHPRRRAIHDVLEAGGLAYLREIHRSTEIPLGSVAYHLRVLQSVGLVASVKKGGYRVYFLASCDLSRSEMERLALLANDTRRAVAEVIAGSEGVSQQELAESVGKSQNWLSRLLSEFEEDGLVERQGDWRSVYKPTGLLERWFANG